MTGIIPPKFPNPPEEYDPRYLDEVVRAFALFLQQTANPGDLRATDAVMTSLPHSPAGLEPGSLWNDGGTVKIVLSEDASFVRPRGLEADGNVGTVSVTSNVENLSVQVEGIRAFGTVGTSTSITSNIFPIDVDVSAENATGEVGQVTVEGSITSAVSQTAVGVQALGGVGSPAIATTVRLNATVPVTGVSATGNLRGPTITTTSKINVSVNLTGVIAASGVVRTPIVQTTTSGSTQPPGGFVETYPFGGPRPRFTQAQLNSFVPTRGVFTFPAPYNTRGYRITNVALDCPNGPVDALGGTYSFWQHFNRHDIANDGLVYCVLMARVNGSNSWAPLVYSINKTTRAVTFHGQCPGLLPRMRDWHGEHNFMHPAEPYSYVFNTAGDGILYKIHILEGTVTTILNLDDHGVNGGFEKVHMSRDGDVVGGMLVGSSSGRCFMYKISTNTFRIVPTKNLLFDESQIDQSGRWLQIKYNPDNDYYDWNNQSIKFLGDEDGAGGHSDMGFGYTVMSDNQSLPGAYYLWNLAGPMQNRTEATLVYRARNWDYSSVGHNSWRHADSSKLPQRQFMLGDNCSGGNSGPHQNEIIAVPLDGSLRALVLCDCMCNISASGGNVSWSNTYYKQPYATCDITGRYAFFMSNINTSRLEAFVVEVPYELLNL